MVSQAIATGDMQAINYFVADKYMKVLAELADSPNQKVLIMPTEVTGVLGSLAGIAEIAKAGADTFVAGSAVFGKPDADGGYRGTVGALRQALASLS